MINYKASTQLFKLFNYYFLCLHVFEKYLDYLYLKKCSFNKIQCFYILYVKNNSFQL